jgi:hypothetical protein
MLQQLCVGRDAAINVPLTWRYSGWTPGRPAIVIDNDYFKVVL